MNTTRTSRPNPAVAVIERSSAYMTEANGFKVELSWNGRRAYFNGIRWYGAGKGADRSWHAIHDGQVLMADSYDEAREISAQLSK